MELDDLKNAWSKDTAQSSLPPEDLKQLLMKRLASSSKGIYRRVVIELGFVLLSYLFMLTLVVVFHEEFGIFFYKTMGVVAIIAIPMSYRMIQSVRMLRKQDLSIPLIDHLELGLAHFRQTIHLYKLFTYAALAILLVIYATDEFFLSLSRMWKAGIVVYIFFFAWITTPYLKWFYGRKVNEMEALLGQLKGE